MLFVGRLHHHRFRWKIIAARFHRRFCVVSGVRSSRFQPKHHSGDYLMAFFLVIRFTNFRLWLLMLQSFSLAEAKMNASTCNNRHIPLYGWPREWMHAKMPTRNIIIMITKMKHVSDMNGKLSLAETDEMPSCSVFAQTHHIQAHAGWQPKRKSTGDSVVTIATATTLTHMKYFARAKCTHADTQTHTHKTLDFKSNSFACITVIRRDMATDIHAFIKLFTDSNNVCPCFAITAGKQRKSFFMFFNLEMVSCCRCISILHWNGNRSFVHSSSPLFCRIVYDYYFHFHFHAAFVCTAHNRWHGESCREMWSAEIVVCCYSQLTSHEH